MKTDKDNNRLQKAAMKMSRQCRHVVQSVLREEEWQDADAEFCNIILAGLKELTPMMLTPKAAAERVGVSTSQIYQLCKERLLPCFRIGSKGKRGKVLIDEHDLTAFVKQCRCERIVPADSLRHISQ